MSRESVFRDLSIRSYGDLVSAMRSHRPVARRRRRAGGAAGVTDAEHGRVGYLEDAEAQRGAASGAGGILLKADCTGESWMGRFRQWIFGCNRYRTYGFRSPPCIPYP